MDMFDRLIKTEDRTLKNPKAPVPAKDILQIISIGNRRSIFFLARPLGLATQKPKSNSFVQTELKTI